MKQSILSATDDGARGIDLIERTPKYGAPVPSFPIYDAHGNNVALLTRDGAGGFTLGSRRSYDA